MNELLPYIIKSTLCLSLLYLTFRTVMRRETFFVLNRTVLLAIIACSILIPLINLPQIILPEMQEKLIPSFPSIENQLPEFPEVADPPTVSGPVNVMDEKPERPFPVMQLIGYLYFAGMLFSLLVLIHGLVTLLLLFRKAEKQKMDGFKLLIIEKDIPAFSFCKMIFISRADYTEHGTTILAHEQQHIRLGHFYDLLLMELAKITHWFNPIIYWLIQDLKAIHEYQADQHMLTKGIDARKYQLLIIEKGVGPQRLALANSFNHCQIKKRITMMNQSKNGKAWRWKVAIFLPLLALLLMAFGREGEKEQKDSPSQKEMLNQEKSIVTEPSTQSKDSIYSIVEVMPEFPGGQKALNKYLIDNIKYPSSAIKANVQGKVFVNYIINSQGKVINPRVVRSVNPELDAEAIRVVKLMPNWTPAKEKGKSVNVSYTLPINFVLWPDPSAKKEGNIAPPPPPPLFKIEIRKDGNYIDNKLYSLEEIANKAEAFQKSHPNGVVSIKMDENVSQERLSEVKEVLRKARISNINLNTTTHKTFHSTEQQSLIKEHKTNNAPPPPRPNNDIHIIKLNKNGTLNYNLDSTAISFEVLEERIKSEFKRNPKLFYDIWVEEGKIDERLNKVKDILKANGDPKIDLTSFHVESKTDSEGKVRTMVSTYHMDNK